MVRNIILFFCTLTFTGIANAALITFEDVTPENGATNVVSFGFNFQSGFAGWLYTPPGGAVETSSSGNPHDSMRLAGTGDSGGGAKIDLPGPGVQMTEVGGASFSAFGFEAATFATTQPSDMLTIAADFLGGGSISTTVDITTSFQSFSLAGFVDIINLSFYSTVAGGAPNDGFQIDDISTTPSAPAPAPATLALFGLGLAGLGWSKRKKA